MTKQTKKKRVLEKEPLSIWEEQAELKDKAKTLSQKNKEREQKMLNEGHTWVQVDERTRKLLKIDNSGRE
ncbi:hypothetical protein [Myroides odoratus]|uniref:Uncharacterized protein n=1 Tax=Myroides odoratus TaxID=256 RepID=A0A378RQE4_MYROD|nr:hypothetical protein [Myroides odoratus]QQU04207.1 hypothetical protein I6I89_02660 [Myroides odoratus]STZ28387.1 Uncharacterised protein [Myroides odoratus]